jgi:predicted permease
MSRWYRAALKAYPRAVREQLADEMESAFSAVLRGVKPGGSRSWLWVRGMTDAVFSGLRFRLRPGLRRALLEPGVHGESGEGDRKHRRRRLDMGPLMSDVRYALRSMVRQPLFALTAVATLALGIGANTAVFSIVYGLLGRPFPYPEADRLVMAWSSDLSRGWTRTDVSLSDAWDWHTRTRVFSDLALVSRASRNLTGGERPERLETKGVTSNLFGVLGASFVVGRGFMEADDRPGAPATVVLSYGYWQRRFGGDPSVVGRVLQLDGEPHTVVGVTAASFIYPDDHPDVYVPLRVVLAEQPRSNRSHVAIGRLAPGVALEQANRELRDLSTALAGEHPETNRNWSAYAVSMRDDVVGEVGRQASVVLMGAVGFVLLMACVNVANLLLARANSRRREISLRGALGAGRTRIVRQLLTESLLLALVGGAVGVMLAIAAVQLIAAAMPPELPAVFIFRVDRAVVLFALSVSVLATILFGLLPALRASAVSGQGLREEGRVGEGRRARRFGGTLVVVQTALAVVLLVGGGIMMRSVREMVRQDLGYDPTGVITLRIAPPSAKYPDAAALQRFYDQVLDRARAIPGVEAAGTIQSLPVRGSNSVNTFRIEGEATRADDGYPARMGYLAPGYLEAMRVPVLRGRSLEATDGAGAPRVLLVNQLLAEQRFGTSDPVGRALHVDDETWTIVGVVANMRERSLQRPPEPSIYLPVAQSGVRSRTLVARVNGDAAAYADALQTAVWAVDPEQPVYEVQPMTALIDSDVSGFRVLASMMLSFAAVSLLLGGVGIYGVTAYAVGRRTNEIGIRMAIGAERKSVMRLIVREGMLRATLGLVLGLGLALLLSRAMQSLLVNVSPTDPLTFVSVTLLLAFVTFLGAWLPARKAARLDPVRALASE